MDNHLSSVPDPDRDGATEHDLDVLSIIPDPGTHQGTGKTLEGICLEIANAFATTPTDAALPTLHVYIRHGHWGWHVHNTEACGLRIDHDNLLVGFLFGPHPTPGQVAEQILDERCPDYRIMQGFATGQIEEGDVL